MSTFPIPHTRSIPPDSPWLCNPQPFSEGYARMEPAPICDILDVLSKHSAHCSDSLQLVYTPSSAFIVLSRMSESRHNKESRGSSHPVGGTG